MASDRWVLVVVMEVVGQRMNNAKIPNLVRENVYGHLFDLMTSLLQCQLDEDLDLDSELGWVLVGMGG
jgi:hypothetical protein